MSAKEFEAMQERMTEDFHSHINAATSERATKADMEHEAQEQARANEISQRERESRKAKRLRSAGRLALAAAIIVGLHFVHKFNHISGEAFTYASGAAFVYFGWCMNNVHRAFRRKQHRK